MSKIVFKSGYKYRLEEDFTFSLPASLCPAEGWEGEFVIIYPDGECVVLAGFCWDGASGAVDNRSMMRAALVHDALYYAMRHGFVIGSKAKTRKEIDSLFRAMMLMDGVFSVRRWYCWAAVRLFGKYSVQQPRGVKVLIY